MSFQNLGLCDEVVHGVQSMGFIDPSQIQEKAIPEILAGKDIIGASQTGTGKTAAFALPLLTLLKTSSPRGPVRSLILEPTRELAQQIQVAIRDYGRFGHWKVALLHGGVSFENQKKALRETVDILVATPGRLLDHFRRGSLNLKGVEHLILDEADRMLDLGFLPDVREIISLCPPREERQTLLFSATMRPEIQKLTAWALKDPYRIEIGPNLAAAETVQHVLFPVATDQKFDLLLALLEHLHYESVLIFTRTKQEADRITHWLKTHSHSVVAFHSDRSQHERQEALDGFRSKKFEVMVATDIASRGIDIANISHVINYHVPQNPEDYVHRIGRTGRGSMKGDALTLMCAEEVKDVLAIERFLSKKIERKKLESFSYAYSLVLEEQTSSSSPSQAIRGGSHRGGYSFGMKRKRKK